MKLTGMESGVSGFQRLGHHSTSLPIRVVVAVLVMLCAASSARAVIDKEATYEEMRALAAQMASLKADVDSDNQAAAAYAAAEGRYRELSELMGGDDPGHVMGGGSAAAAHRSVGGAHAVPSVPSSCAPTTTSFSQSTATAIPTGPAVVTSSVVVAGVGPYLFDVDLTTNLTHTFAADLDITLMSPAGTIVTLTTDNGAGNDNVFNGTLWDDDANPGGQVPYVTNNGLVTDHPYVNLTLASPLVPEEAMAAFIGEDPNGTWTITISDDLPGDGGSLASWTLAVTTLPMPPITVVEPTVTQSTAVVIPTGPAVVTSMLAVAGAGTSLLDLDLTTFITHTFPADLDITLMSPGGTIVTLTTDNGGGNDNVFNGTVWDDDANPGGQVPYVTNNGLVTDHAYMDMVLASPLVPEEAMGAFIGEDPNGTWTLTISDDLAPDGGSLDSWSLDIDTFACDTPTPTSTPTPTGTPTPTQTATPTNTLIPIGGSCDDPADCDSGNCVDDVCCTTSSCPPVQSCNNPESVGTCSPDPPAPVPLLSRTGVLFGLALLVVIGGMALVRRRHGASGRRP